MEHRDQIELAVAPHPLLELQAFVTVYPNPLEELEAPVSLRQLLTLDAPAPLQSSDDIRSAVRDLLRHGGFKPTGRSKPASEYLIKAAEQQTLSSINVAVDACNAVSLHSGLPISVVDCELARAPFRVQLAPPASEYVFNASGQTIDVGRLLCLCDAQGPCANAIKDSQRTKTNPQTRRTLTVIWGTNRLPGRAANAASWYYELLEACGARIEPVKLVTSPVESASCPTRNTRPPIGS